MVTRIKAKLHPKAYLQKERIKIQEIIIHNTSWMKKTVR